MLRDSRNVAIIYRIYIKIATTNIAPGTLKKSPRNQTLLIDKSYILIIGNYLKLVFHLEVIQYKL
jgi:hypothetical protein